MKAAVGFMKVNETDVPGNYEAKADWGGSSLKLLKDHSFQQTVRLNGGEIKHIDGRWKLIGPAEHSAVYDITLSPCLNVAHDKQGVYSPGSISSITPSLLGLEIAADPDWGISYRKRS